MGGSGRSSVPATSISNCQEKKSEIKITVLQFHSRLEMEISKHFAGSAPCGFKKPTSEHHGTSSAQHLRVSEVVQDAVFDLCASLPVGLMCHLQHRYYLITACVIAIGKYYPAAPCCRSHPAARPLEARAS